MLLVGFKLSSAKELVQTIERRQELRLNLSIVRTLLEIEDTKAWIKDVAHDTKQREDRIAELESASGHVYGLLEDALIAKGDAMFAVFDAKSVGAKLSKHSALVYSETQLEASTGLLYGRAAATVRATPQEIVAYCLISDDSRFMQSTTNPTVFIRSEVVAHANAHHTITFNRCKATGISDRTFLNSVVAKKVEDDPPTYVLVILPIAQHHKITAKDEKGAVRAEACRAFKLTEVAEGITKLEYVCSLNLGGSIPQAITNKVAVPEQEHCAPSLIGSRTSIRLHTIFASRDHSARIDSCFDRLWLGAVPTTLQRYFQQIRPIEKCNAEDGRVVGHMLHDLISSKPEDLARSIREFAHRTAMLRGCGFAHIGDMLACLLRADVQGKSYDGTTAIPSTPVPTGVARRDSSSLTKEQAVAIGNAIVSSVREASALAAGLEAVIRPHAVLRAMESEYTWFVPMLEVVMASKTGVASNVDAVDEESGFSSVVRLGAHASCTAACASAIDALRRGLAFCTAG